MGKSGKKVEAPQAGQEEELYKWSDYIWLLSWCTTVKWDPAHVLLINRVVIWIFINLFCVASATSPNSHLSHCLAVCRKWTKGDALSSSMQFFIHDDHHSPPFVAPLTPHSLYTHLKAWDGMDAQIIFCCKKRENKYSCVSSWPWCNSLRNKLSWLVRDDGFYSIHPRIASLMQACQHWKSSHTHTHAHNRFSIQEEIWPSLLVLVVEEEWRQHPSCHFWSTLLVL